MTGALCTRLSSMCNGVVCHFDAHVLGPTSAHAHPYASQLYQVLDARVVCCCAVLSDGASVALLCARTAVAAVLCLQLAWRMATVSSLFWHCEVKQLREESLVHANYIVATAET